MGGEDVRHYGTPLGVQEPTGTQGRPVAGPADPETRRRMLKEQMAQAKIDAALRIEQERAERARIEAARRAQPGADLSAYGAARKIIERRGQIDKAVE